MKILNEALDVSQVNIDHLNDIRLQIAGYKATHAIYAWVYEMPHQRYLPCVLGETLANV